MGYGLEVEMIRQARELDLLTAPYVFTEDEARAMAEAGADVLVPHMGLTTGGTIGARTGSRSTTRSSACRRCTTRRRAVNPDILVPLPRRPDRRARRRRSTSSSTPTGIVGFFGASSMERLPTEIAMTENMQRFKSIPIQETA